MPLIKKQPAILTREFRIEAPVSELVDDYARFIESSTDHVVNAVLILCCFQDETNYAMFGSWRDPERSIRL